MIRRLAFCFLIAAVALQAACTQSAAEPQDDLAPAARPGPMTVRFHIASTEAHPGWREMKDESGQRLFVSPEPLLTEADIVSAEALHGAARSIVRLRCSGVGGDRLRRATAENTGKHLAILIDDKLLTAPLIQAEIAGGVAHIDGRFSPQRASEIAESLNPGP
ncbi:preprotein translocase subunit SecD [Phycisphaerae bacterium RAS1]|nr:preprotein translocase subunit SecD [Phycisphaerae bacterium RAS1]